MSASEVRVSKNGLKSRAWNFFKIKDNVLKIAKCKICQSVLSYRTSVTNLLKHVRKRHKQAYLCADKSENSEISAFSLSENEDGDLEDNNTIKVPESHETKNEEESVCLLCQKTFQNQNSAEMMEHMFKVHNISQIKLVDGNIHLEQEENKSVKYNVSKRSCCWDYFTMKDKEEKIAVCNLCNRELSFKSTVSNLIKHLQRKHNIVPKRGQAQYKRDMGDKNKPRSAIWAFYNYINDERTVCACIHCNKEFSVVGGMTNMKRHLVDKHPDALLHHKTNGDPLFISATDENNEESEEENLQVEYLDFDELDIQDNVKRKPNIERKSSLEERSSFERRLSRERHSSFERSTKRSRTRRSPVRIYNELPGVAKVPDSLEHFSNYITSLLQELPEKISKKLQMNFVKQIIEAQISCAEIENAKEIETRLDSSVGGNMAKSDESITIDESVSVSEGNTTASVKTINSDRVVTVSNGIIIHPRLTPS